MIGNIANWALCVAHGGTNQRIQAGRFRITDLQAATNERQHFIARAFVDLICYHYGRVTCDTSEGFDLNVNEICLTNIKYWIENVRNNFLSGTWSQDGVKEMLDQCSSVSRAGCFDGLYLPFAISMYKISSRFHADVAFPKGNQWITTLEKQAWFATNKLYVCNKGPPRGGLTMIERYNPPRVAPAAPPPGSGGAGSGGFGGGGSGGHGGGGSGGHGGGGSGGPDMRGSDGGDGESSDDDCVLVKVIKAPAKDNCGEEKKPSRRDDDDDENKRTKKRRKKNQDNRDYYGYK